MLRMKNIILSLFLAGLLGILSTGLAQNAQASQVSIIDQLTDFVTNSSIEFMINGNKVGQQIPVYAENQDVGFSIVSQTSGYHYLYVVTGEGSSRLIYPNAFETQAYIQAGQQTNFPNSNAYRLIAQLGQGTDFHIVSIVSPTPLTGFTIGFTNGFNIIPPATQVIPGYQAAAMRFRVQASSQTAANCGNNCVYLNASPALAQAAVNAPATSTTTNTGSTGSFQGFATYQEYLDNYYAQNNTSATPAPVIPNQAPVTPTYTYSTPAPVVTPVPVTVTPVTVSPTVAPMNNYSITNYAAPTTNTTTGTFQGFASYQAYLDNYYAQNGGQPASQATSQPAQAVATLPANQTVVTTPVATQANIATPVTVYTTFVGSGAATAQQAITTQPVTTQPVSTQPVSTNTSTGAFQGFASYQDYLDSFYAQNSSFANMGNSGVPAQTVATTQQPVETDPFHGFGSYEAYLANYQATVGLTSASTTTTGNNYSVYNVVPTQTTQTPNYAVNYSINQQLQNNGVNYTQLSPQPVTQPVSNLVTTVNTDYSQPGFFDFEVGTNYTLFNSLGIKVLSIQDNRCPAGVQCVQAGNVVTTVEIQFANVRRSFTITILSGDEPTIGVGNTSLRFIGLSDTSSTALRVYVVTR